LTEGCGQAAGRAPQHTLDWLRAFPRVTHHHHVAFVSPRCDAASDSVLRADMAADLARVARCVEPSPPAAHTEREKERERERVWADGEL
jgi:hypothetical protein